MANAWTNYTGNVYRSILFAATVTVKTSHTQSHVSAEVYQVCVCSVLELEILFLCRIMYQKA